MARDRLFSLGLLPIEKPAQIDEERPRIVFSEWLADRFPAKTPRPRVESAAQKARRAAYFKEWYATNREGHLARRRERYARLKKRKSRAE